MGSRAKKPKKAQPLSLKKLGKDKVKRRTPKKTKPNSAAVTLSFSGTDLPRDRVKLVP